VVSGRSMMMATYLSCPEEGVGPSLLDASDNGGGTIIILSRFSSVILLRDQRQAIEKMMMMSWMLFIIRHDGWMMAGSDEVRAGAPERRSAVPYYWPRAGVTGGPA
jgi:hypothetical protein